MSRTYKCTKGKSKKLKGKFESYLLYGYYQERGELIDYLNGLDSELAILYRKGIQQNAPKKYRKLINRSNKAKDKMYLKRKIREGKLEEVVSKKSKKNASYLYF